MCSQRLDEAVIDDMDEVSPISQYAPSKAMNHRDSQRVSWSAAAVAIAFGPLSMGEVDLCCRTKRASSQMQGPCPRCGHSFSTLDSVNSRRALRVELSGAR